MSKHLALANNGELKAAFAELRNWCNSKAVAELTIPEQLRNWKADLQCLTQKDLMLSTSYQSAWEGTLFIRVALKRENHTIAFIQFAQLLERLLFIRCKAERWINRKIITPQETYRGSLEDYNPGLGGLLYGWCKLRSYGKDHQWAKLLDAIREERNEIVHAGRSINDRQIRSLWKKSDWDDSPEVFKLMMQVLNQVIEKQWTPPTNLLLQSLYDWGITILQ